jgi:hypothetical protein
MSTSAILRTVSAIAIPPSSFRAAFLDEAAGVAERFLGTDLIREKRHIGDD